MGEVLGTNNCSGSHRYFVAQDASFEGKIFILLVCTSCGESKKIEFPIAPKSAEVRIRE